MAEEVYGPFSSIEEAVKTVNILELEGYFKENITIFSHGKYADKLNENADVAITSTETAKNREQSFLDKVSKVIFNGVKETSDIYEELINKGLSEKQAAQHAEQIKSGKILITSNRALKMGNDPTQETDEQKMKESINHVE
ncbi:hypothetical protein GCM10007063_08530 [Lentibacillus kapialis]|uniref:General stress protein 17M-like domain-containing protein n=1 Tax=Lentibacillus kapialis TaxID=340214 RepID=A0A917PRC4_9BACI|nr:general stress protein [Lentibacillus kapialis]GGJ88293.1 hypothetical protein GCM10007063_08530 [Lentibacillus kapialis]